MWVKCVLVWYSQPPTSIFGLVNSSIKKVRLECRLHPSHFMIKTMCCIPFTVFMNCAKTRRIQIVGYIFHFRDCGKLPWRGERVTFYTHTDTLCCYYWAEMVTGPCTYNRQWSALLWGDAVGSYYTYVQYTRHTTLHVSWLCLLTVLV